MARKNENAARRSLEIRLMELDDLPAVYHLGEQLFTSADLPILYRTWDPYEVTGAFTSDPEFCFVAEAEGRVVGFILGTTIEKEGTAWKKYGYVAWIGVDEEFQGTHLGRRLYRKLEARFRKAGVRMVLLDTDEENKEAIAFFEAQGFSVRARHAWLVKTLPRTDRSAPSNHNASGRGEGRR